ncbi:MAG: reverse transcriptase domain-containing protein, partial [Lactococcus garvieae]
MKGSPYRSVAKWLAKIIEPIRRELSKHSLKDSFEFVDRIKDKNLKETQMYSFDVASLFTNVPVIETVNYLCEWVEHNPNTISIPIPSLKELLLRCTMNVQLLLNKKIYRQVDGVAMGSPLGPILADIFMSKLENNQLKSDIENLDTYCRYVDDIFIVSPTSTNITNLLKKFNAAHEAIQFTVEKEVDGELPFLDIMVRKTESGIPERTIYRKKTWSGQYNNFQSFVPIQYKRNLIRCLTNRAHRICSTHLLEQELDFIRKTLIDNGFPEKFISKNMKPPQKKPTVHTVKKKELFLKVPFNGDSNATTLANRLRRAVQRTYPAGSLRIVFTTRPLIAQTLKDKLPRQTTSMCIYLFTCSCGTRYIGRTTRSLSTRIKEHQPAWLANGNNYIRKVNSAITQHLVETGHRPTADCFTIIYKVPLMSSEKARVNLLAIAEASAIRLMKPEL